MILGSILIGAGGIYLGIGIAAIVIGVSIIRSIRGR